MADFLLRLAFFVVAPFVIVAAALLFPVRAALVDVGLALSVFVMGEALKRKARAYRFSSWLFAQAFEFESFYAEKPPRRFAYYLFYPLLFPYWLLNREARREFLVFRGYTLGSFIVLVATLVWQYFSAWAPELSVAQYLPAVVLTLTVETLLVLALLMPIATTVVWYHSSFRRGRLVMLLVAGLVSTAASLAFVSQRRDPVVSFMTRERVRLRKAADPRKAHKVMIGAARAAWRELVFLSGVEGDGKVEGSPLETARERLAQFFKPDEAGAFEIWAAPRRHPRILVLYFEARPEKPPIWVAIGGDGREIKKSEDLPRGAFLAMKRAADGTDAVLPVWPDGIEIPGT